MAYGQGMGGGPDSSGVEGLGADAFGDGNTGGGKDANAGPAIDQADAISGMANNLENAANAVEMGFDPSAQALGGPAVQSGLAVGPSLGSKSRQQRDFGTIAMQDYDPSTYDHYDFSGQNVNVVSPLDQKEAFMGANPSTPSVSLDSLGATPTIGELSAAIGINPAQLDPSAAPAGVDTNQNAVESALGINMSPGYQGAIASPSPNRTENYERNKALGRGLGLRTQDDIDKAAQLAAATASTDKNRVEAYNAFHDALNVNPSPNVDDDTINAPQNALETAQFDMDALNAHLQSRNTFGLGYDTPGVSTDTTLASWDAKTAPAISQVDSFSTFDDQTNPFGPYGHPAPHLGALLDAGPNVETPGFKADVESFDVQNAPATDPETTPAPKYSPKKGFVDDKEMYPDHAKKAAMAGVASVKSMLDGSWQGWIDDINEDMEDRGIALSHTLDGKAPNGIPFGEEGTNLSGKHSAADWGEYNGKFSPDENGIPVDSNGVAMPGTEKQAQAGMSGVLQGLWGGIFSGAGKFFEPSTSSGVIDQAGIANTDYGTMATEETDYDMTLDPSTSTPTGQEGGDHPVNFMRSIYPWAASLPYSVLFNAAKYPDYLRLLIEADATGTELPMAIPQWILDGKSAPETTNVNLIQNHPALQAQVT